MLSVGFLGWPFISCSKPQDNTRTFLPLLVSSQPQWQNLISHLKSLLTFLSLETYESYQFLTNLEYRMKNSNVFNPASSALKSPKPAEFDHVSFLSGIRIIQPRRNPMIESGYQVHRLATELIPAYFAILGPKMISPFWSVLFYFTMIMLGIAQCLALFHTVIQGMIAIKPSGLKSWEGSITFCVCAIGFVLGLPMGTEVSVSSYHHPCYCSYNLILDRHICSLLLGLHPWMRLVGHGALSHSVVRCVRGPGETLWS